VDELAPLTPHRMRLRGPWNFRPLAVTELRADGSLLESPDVVLPPGGTMKIPGDWGESLGESFVGRVVFIRRFGCPTNLSRWTEVFLVFEGLDAFGDVWLNGSHVGSLSRGAFSGRFPITSYLQPRNVLEVQVECPGMSRQQAERWRPPGRAGLAGGLVGHVVLEIHEPAEARTRTPQPP
jgi:hypothetical protein